MAEAYIIDAVRTPRGIGKQGKGALAHMHPQHLAATCLAAIKDRNDLDTSTVDDVIWSVSTQDGMQAGDLGRMAALDAERFLANLEIDMDGHAHAAKEAAE